MEKKAFWEKFGNLTGLNWSGWSLLGEFNVLRFLVEKISEGGFSRFTREFNKFMRESRFTLVPSSC